MGQGRAGSSSDDVPPQPGLDFATAEDILRAHIVYLRGRLEQEDCVRERLDWSAAQDEVAAILLPSPPASGQDSASAVLESWARERLADLAIVVFFVIGILALSQIVTRYTSHGMVWHARHYVLRTRLEPFRQRRALQKWRGEVQARVPWIGAQALAQQKANRLTQTFRQQHLRRAFLMLGLAELVLLGLNLLPDLAHAGVRYLLGPLAPFLARLVGLVVGDNGARGSTYHVVRATETLYILYYIGPIILSVFFGTLLWVTDSARLVLSVRPVQSLVPALREDVARRRHAALQALLEAQQEQLTRLDESLRLTNASLAPTLSIAGSTTTPSASPLSDWGNNNNAKAFGSASPSPVPHVDADADTDAAGASSTHDECGAGEE